MARRALLGWGLVAFGLGACGRDDPRKVPPPAPTALTTAPAPSALPSGDPFPLGYCELKVGANAPVRSPGGQGAVSSKYWEIEKSFATPFTRTLLINCGTTVHLTLSAAPQATDAEIPMKAGRYPIQAPSEDKKGAKKAVFIVSGQPGIVIEKPGEIEIESWDRSGVRGSFHVEITSSGIKTAYEAKFDFKATRSSSNAAPAP